MEGGKERVLESSHAAIVGCLLFACKVRRLTGFTPTPVLLSLVSQLHVTWLFTDGTSKWTLKTDRTTEAAIAVS